MKYQCPASTCPPVRRQVRLVRFLSTLLTLACAPVLLAQLTPSRTPTPRDLQRSQLKAEAFEAVSRGDMTTALNKLEAMRRKTPNAHAADIQVASNLVFFSGQLKSAGKTDRSAEVLQLALTKLAKPVGRMDRKNASEALLISAQINDHLLLNRSEAIRLYQEALDIDPLLPRVAERLLHLKAIDEHSRRKIEAAEQLRRHAATVTTERKTP